MYFHYDNVLLK